MRHDYGSSPSSSLRRLSEENRNAATGSGYSGYSSSEDSIFRPFRSTSMLDSSNRPRSHSVPSSPLNFPSRSFRDQEQDQESASSDEWQRHDLHHSMPNMHFSFSARNRTQSIDEMEEMHHSLPNMNFEAEFDFEPEETTVAAPAVDATSMMTMEPVPLNIAFTGARTEQVPSSSPRTRRPGYHHHDQIPMERVVSRSFSDRSGAVLPPQQQQQHIGSAAEQQQTPSDSISRDLILCLEKLTESHIADPDDPYAPIPLSPQGLKRRPSLAVDKRRDLPKIDDLAPSATFDV
jgi:hypothetical protein